MKKFYTNEHSALASELIKNVNEDVYKELFDQKYIKKGCELEDCHFRNTLTIHTIYQDVTVLSFDTDNRDAAQTFLSNLDKYQQYQTADLEKTLKSIVDIYNSYNYGITKIKNIEFPKKWIDLLPKKNRIRYYQRFRFKIPTHNRNVKGILKKSNLMIDFMFKYIEEEHRLIPVALVKPPLGAAHQGIYFVSLDPKIKSIWKTRYFEKITEQEFFDSLENSLEKYWYNQVFKVIGKKEYPNKKYKDMTEDEREGYRILANMMAI
jgi:hypothetical protein